MDRGQGHKKSQAKGQTMLGIIAVIIYSGPWTKTEPLRQVSYYADHVGSCCRVSSLESALRNLVPRRTITSLSTREPSWPRRSERKVSLGEVPCPKMSQASSRIRSDPPAYPWSLHETKAGTSAGMELAPSLFHRAAVPNWGR